MESLLLFLPLVLAMWFLVLRPQQARLRAQRDLVASLSAGDRVVTAGGIVGTLTVVGESEVTLVTTPGVREHVARNATPGIGPQAVCENTISAGGEVADADVAEGRVRLEALEDNLSPPLKPRV